MTRFQDCLIVQRETDWWIQVGSETETLSLEASAEELVTCVEVMSRLAGVTKFQCVLAPASTSCFFVRFDLPRDADFRDRVELTYALEDHLPIDAESMVADFRPLADEREDERTVTAVSIEVDAWQGICDAFESRGIAVRSIVPAAVLAHASLIAQFEPSAAVDCFLLGDDVCDWIRSVNGQVTHWKHLALDSVPLTRQKVLEPVQTERRLIVGSNQASAELIESVFGSCESVDEPTDVLHLNATEQLLKRRITPFDLRRGALGPPDPLRLIQVPMRFAIAATIVFLMTIVGASWYRTQRISAAIDALQVEQRELFESAFPDARVPAALLRRVRSEHTRVMVSRGRGTKVDLPVSGHSVLNQLLAALPDDLRFRITRIEVEDGKVRLELQVRSPVDAGTLASEIAAAGFDVKPPVTTQSDAKTFDSTLEAEWSDSARLSDSSMNAGERMLSGALIDPNAITFNDSTERRRSQ